MAPQTKAPTVAELKATIKALEIQVKELQAPSPESLAYTLAQRQAIYGSFEGHAEITQKLKDFMYTTPKYDGLAYAHKEALEMIAHKIGRILNGDPNYQDSWHDIQGYAKLGEEACDA